MDQAQGRKDTPRRAACVRRTTSTRVADRLWEANDKVELIEI